MSQTTLIGPAIVWTGGEDPALIPSGGVAISGEKIAAVGTWNTLRSRYPSAETVAANGLLLPGLVCAHHHLYSSLACGIRLKKFTARNFVQVLKQLWWPLDEALDRNAIYHSALVGLMDCLHCGVTSVIDHHESQGSQRGVLSEIARAAQTIGVRVNLCLGASDRRGKGEEGLEEGERFLESLAAEKAGPGGERKNGLVTGSVGLHALFTVSEKTLRQAVEQVRRLKVGLHLHVAEDAADQTANRRRFGKRCVERLGEAGALGPRTLLAHAIHLSPREIGLLARTKTLVVHNPESNMNNAVGCADVLRMLRRKIRVGLGTDGMSSDMLGQMRCSYLLLRHHYRRPSGIFAEPCEMLLKHNPAIFEALSGVKVGSLQSGGPADIAVLDYVPATPIGEDNFYGHLLFGASHSRARHVWVNGKPVLRDGRILCAEEEKVRAEARKAAQALWERMR